MLIKNNILKRIDDEDVIDGVFIAPDEVLYIDDDFHSQDVVKMILPSVREIGNCFLYFNKTLVHFEAPKLEKIGEYFLFCNSGDVTIEIPNIVEIGFSFMCNIKNFNYNIRILKSMNGQLYISNILMNKKECIRKLNMNKIL